MPTYPPRIEATRKKEQLEVREVELRHAIQSSFSFEKLNKIIEKYRLSKLSFLKAKLHEFREREFQKLKNTISPEKIEAEISEWQQKSSFAILDEIKAKLH